VRPGVVAKQRGRRERDAGDADDAEEAAGDGRRSNAGEAATTPDSTLPSRGPPDS
jgi:hypothetical protein